MNPMRRLVALTFDIDLINHVTGEPSLHDLEAMPRLLDLLDMRGCVATWFLRLDDSTRAVFGDAEFMFRRHRALIDRLRERGDEIGWHPHLRRHRPDAWDPRVEVPGMLSEIATYGPMARRHALRAVRMGHGFHTNETIRTVANAGFTVDSSAIPRPMYPWDDPPKNWTTTPSVPYRPALADYRVPGEPSLGIVEIPMSVAHVPAPTDTQHVMRYLNLAFRHDAQAPALASWFDAHDLLVTMTHPCELLPLGSPHPLVGGGFDDCARNLDAIAFHAARSGDDPAFVTVSDLASLTAGTASAPGQWP
jgi:hypothetical protein